MKDECSPSEKIAAQATEIAVLKERLEAMDRALIIQAEEYSRRLEELNHSHKLANERNSLFVTRELHDRLESEVNDRLNELRDRITSIESHTRGISDMWGFIVGAAVIAGGLVAVIDRFIM